MRFTSAPQPRSETLAVRSNIVNGIQWGYRIGFDYRNTCWSKKCNMRSASGNLQVVGSYLEEECKAGKVVAHYASKTTHQYTPGVLE